MSSQLSVSQARELLERLKAAVRDFAGREEKLTTEHRNLAESAERRLHEAAQEEKDAAARELAEEGARFSEVRIQLQSKYHTRKTRLGDAMQAAKRRALEASEQEEGRRKYAVQKGTLDARRHQEQSLARNDATLAEFHRQLTANHEQFVELERRADQLFRGYRKLRQILLNPVGTPPPDLAPDEYHLLERLENYRAQTTQDLARFRRRLMPAMFRTLPLGLWIVFVFVCSGAAIPLLRYFGRSELNYSQVAAAAGGALLFMVGLYFFGRHRARPLATRIAQTLETARRLHNASLEKSQARHQREIQRIESELTHRLESLDRDWQEALEQASQARRAGPTKIEEKWRRAHARLERLHGAKTATLERKHAEAVARLKHDAEERHRRLSEERETRAVRFDMDYKAQWQKLETEWNETVDPIYRAIDRAKLAAEDQFPPWHNDIWLNWTPPDACKNAAKFGRLEVHVPKFAEAIPTDPRLALPAPAVSIPLVLTYPREGSILFETNGSGNDAVVAALNNILLRLLAITPAGKLSLTIIDPVRLGQNFSGIMHLADYEDQLLDGRIWTQPAQIEERLANLNEHMEKVIQMYLRNEYETIAEYNLEAGNMAEKYHFLVVADFPSNFSESAVRRLLRIAASGARCGVFTLIHWDHRLPVPPDLLPDELRKNSICLVAEGSRFLLAHPPLPRAEVLLDMPPSPDLATKFLHRVGEVSRGSNRVEVPFTQVAPPPEEVWTLETTDELRVPIGRSGATKLQYLSMGKGTRQHALVAGKTGSGKSTLFHVIITNLALWCSPTQIEFYLVDFKKGVEFKCYAARRLPHARVVAIESDREFGLSVLQRVDEELRRRGDLFRHAGVQDLPGYKRAGGGEPMPRWLLVIDEFQEFFAEDDRISQGATCCWTASSARAAPLASMSCSVRRPSGGAYTLARTTLGQMVIRIALQCNEADAYLIMDENNPAPRLLSRPGEGIYNDMAGLVEANSPFQTVWLPDDERDACLDRVRALADAEAAAHPGPIVFEGNAPADVRENSFLRDQLAATEISPAAQAHFWLGAPNAIKSPTEAVFRRQSGNNLLIVGQREEATLAILSIGLISLAAQFPRGRARFVILENTAPGSTERTLLETAARAAPHEILLGKAGELPQLIQGLSDSLQARAEDDQGVPEMFLVVHGLQNFKKLRPEDEFNFASDEGAPSPASQFQKLIGEGPSHGIHVIATVDTYNNVNRFLGRKTLSEFEMRVLFQMSANDSATLCDDPKASTLGLHRALLYNEQEGYLETFRPYALPGTDWLEAAAGNLRRLAGE